GAAGGWLAVEGVGASGAAIAGAADPAPDGAGGEQEEGAEGGVEDGVAGEAGARGKGEAHGGGARAGRESISPLAFSGPWPLDLHIVAVRHNFPGIKALVDARIVSRR